ncbi:hypothetical protein LTR17_000573 [Elasticomyces elasticus]|nr:hypothetical protein LTR17_000573 [Elasticomyces elasticus]
MSATATGTPQAIPQNNLIAPPPATPAIAPTSTTNSNAASTTTASTSASSPSGPQSAAHPPKELSTLAGQGWKAFKKIVPRWIRRGVFAAGLIIAVYYAQKQMQLSTWTAEHDFRGDCLADLARGITSPECDLVLSHAANPPPMHPPWDDQAADIAGPRLANLASIFLSCVWILHQAWHTLFGYRVSHTWRRSICELALMCGLATLCLLGLILVSIW